VVFIFVDHNLVTDVTILHTTEPQTTSVTSYCNLVHVYSNVMANNLSYN
jgi:hypothetical protein